MNGVVMAERESLGSGRHALSIDQLEEGVRAGNMWILARAITLVESGNPKHQVLAEELLTRLLPNTGNSIRVGITGVPGVGKSTFIEALGVQLVNDGHRVAVLAVDPSSGISGGSILGDKTRMGQLSTEPRAYIRPSPSAGTLGGVAHRTKESLLICEAAGYDVVLVETVGVGQSETMVADMTDCFLALMLPGAGDELQGIKRGLLELVDVIAVNKADGSTKLAAHHAAQQIDLAIKSLSGRAHDSNAPTVVTCSALERHGIAEVWQAVERCHAKQLANGSLEERRSRQNQRWTWRLIEQQLREAIQEHPNVRGIREELERQVATGDLTPSAAARQILSAFGLKNPTI